MNAQEIFDASVRHLFSMTDRSVRNVHVGNKTYPACAYRGVNGAKCVVGFFIPDEAFTPEMDTRSDNSATAIIPDFASSLPPFMMEHRQLLSFLQTRIHDPENNWTPGVGPSFRMIGALVAYARDKGFDTSVLNDSVSAYQAKLVEASA